MDLYNTIANWTGWPAVVASLILAMSYGYWLLRNHITLLKEKTQWLESQLEHLKKDSPDVLVRRLGDRVQILTEELERLYSDQKASQSEIEAKEAELEGVKSQIAGLKDRLEDTLTFLSDRGLVCPHCGSPLEIREHRNQTVEIGGRAIDDDHEIVLYECGFELADGRVVKECPVHTKAN